MTIRIAWQDSEEKLKTEFEAASDTKIRARLQQLWLIRQGYRIPEASRIAGMARAAGYKNVERYQMKGLSGIREDKHGGFRHSRCRLSEEQHGMLSDESAKHGFSSRKAGVAWVKAKFNVTYSGSGLGLLFARLGITLKCRAP